MSDNFKNIRERKLTWDYEKNTDLNFFPGTEKGHNYEKSNFVNGDVVAGRSLFRTELAPVARALS